MRFLLYLSFFSLISCSTSKVKETRSSQAPSGITKESFKKERALKTSEFNDFYVDRAESFAPALQDETLDRYSVGELEKLADNKDPLIEIAVRCSKKDFNKAFAVASKVFDKFQKIPAYWNLIANCHLNQGFSRKALLFYNKALEVSPNYVPALNNIGVYYSRQGEDQKALLAFEKANKFSRFAKTPRYNLARLYLAYGLADSALPLFQGLLNEAPNDFELVNAVANCHFIKSNYQTAFTLFNRLPPTVLSRAEFALNYAVTLKKLGRMSDAQKIYSGINRPKTQEFKEYYSSVGTQLGVN